MATRGIALNSRRRPVRALDERTALQVGDHLLDDGVPPATHLGVQHRQRRVGDHAVVAVPAEQLVLLITAGAGRVQPFDPAHDQPGGDMLGLAPGW
jgi:hypothetical protein